MSSSTRSISAALFKAQCLALLDEVADSRQPLTVTKRGKPVATVVPAAPPVPKSLRGSVRTLGDIVGPILGDWDLDR